MMPGTATGSTQSGSPLKKAGVHKSLAPAPPGDGGQRAGSSTAIAGVTAISGNLSSRNFPDVTAGITDIYDPSDIVTRTGDSVVPDYPMDSLPRHASTHSLPANPSSAHPGPAGSTAVAQRVSVPSDSNRSNGERISPRALNAPQTIVPVTCLSSSTGSIPAPIGGMTPMTHTGHIPAQLPPQVYSVSHPIPVTNIPPTVSHSNVSVNVSHSGLAQVHGDPRQIRTQDLNVGVVARLDPHRQGSNILPDLVTQSQPPPQPRQVPTPQRPTVPVTDPRLAQPHRHIVDPHARHRHHRHHGRTQRHSRRHSQSAEEPCKESCYKCLAVGTSFRWILVVLSLLGVCCVVTGIILAALHAAGNSFLFLAIMFIGLGVLLVVVVGVGWKCTPRGHEPLHALFNLGDFRHRGRGRRHRGERRRRDGRWYGGAMYAEFQYRRPPPSYNASMQEYQQQLAAQQSQGPDLYDPENIPDEDYSLPSSPPPSYRSRASTVRAGIQITFPPNQGGDYPDSRPPTYRSHPSNTLQGRHTRPSLTRDDDDNDADDVAPADVAFTGSSVIVDTNTQQNSTSIQISPAVATNQNVTVSVTTVSVTTSPPAASALHPPLEGQRSTAAPSDSVDTTVDPVGEGEADRVETAL